MTTTTDRRMTVQRLALIQSQHGENENGPICDCPRDPCDLALLSWAVAHVSLEQPELIAHFIAPAKETTP